MRLKSTTVWLGRKMGVRWHLVRCLPEDIANSQLPLKETYDDDVEGFDDIVGEDIMVRVRVQRSGGGMAEVSPMTVNAGDRCVNHGYIHR